MVSAEGSDGVVIITKVECRKERSGEELVRQTYEKGMLSFIPPNKERIEWYKKVFVEDEKKGIKKRIRNEARKYKINL